MQANFFSTPLFIEGVSLLGKVTANVLFSLSYGNPRTLDSLGRVPACCFVKDNSLSTSGMLQVSSNSVTLEFHLCKSGFASLKILMALLFCSQA